MSSAGCWPELSVLGRAHNETQATQPIQGRAGQVSVIHTFQYISAN